MGAACGHRGAGVNAARSCPIATSCSSRSRMQVAPSAPSGRRRSPSSPANSSRGATSSSSARRAAWLFARRAKRRSTRSRARKRRAMRAPSTGAISPREMAVQTRANTFRTSSTVRNDARPTPRRSAGSMARRGGGRSDAPPQRRAVSSRLSAARSHRIPTKAARRRLNGLSRLFP